jgi:translation initiation factor 2 beta subunit (eIF-2beta)/eIF-5
MVSIAYTDFFVKVEELTTPSFDEMLVEFYSKKKEQVNKGIDMKPPEIDKKTNKTIWKNFKSWLKEIRRNPDQVLEFIKSISEFPVTTVTAKIRDGISFNSKEINQKYIINVMKKYLDKFVVCPQCNSCKTKLSKHDLSHTWTMKCKFCSSESIVSLK